MTWMAILGGWELAAHIVPRSAVQGSPLVPSWEFTFTTALKGLSGAWTLPFWAPNPIDGGKETYLGAFLAVGYSSCLTLVRLVLGMVVGVVLGAASGFAVSYWAVVRRVIWTPLNFLRMTPLLAAIPLFQFWLGANDVGTTVFIAFGVWVLLMVWTINSVQNVPAAYVESARTLGAKRMRTYFTVVVPGALPALRTGLLLAAGLSWSLAVGAEYLGLPNGLGSVMATAESFTNTGRMLIVAILVGVYALGSFLLVSWGMNRVTPWVYASSRGSGLAGGMGAAAVSGAVGDGGDE